MPEQSTVGGSLAFLTNWVRGRRINPKKLIARQTSGDGMEPRISDGDTLLVDLGPDRYY